MTLIHQIAAAIAKANGDDYADVPRNKAEWARGHWRSRELNEPMQVDYDAMAEAALRALVEAVSASIVDDDKDLPTAADVRGILSGSLSGDQNMFDPLERQIKAVESRDAGLCCCHACLRDRGELRAFMVLCPECGNKRCPKASDHRLACTGSNDSGQEGSIYA